MANRAEQKAKAREERLAREREAAAAAQRRKRLYTIAGALVVAIIVVAVVIAVASGGGSSSSGGSSGSAVTKLLTGIPQNGRTLGRPGAPVTVTVYEDLECPVCKEFSQGAQHDLIQNEIRAGKAKMIFKSLQTATPDLATFQFQQQAAIAAGRQNKLWNFVETFYKEQGPEGTPYVTEGFLTKIAKQIPGLDVSQWSKTRKTADLSSAVTGDLSEAHNKGFNSTPTIVVQGPDASPAPVQGAIAYSDLQKMVKKAGG